MNLIFLLLFTLGVLSDASPNIMARALSTLSDLNPLRSTAAPREVTAFYTVYPTDPKNATETVETEAYLKTLFNPDDVLANSNAEGTISWRVTVDNDAIINQLKTHPGVCEVEPSKARRSTLEPKAILTYFATASDPANKTETTETKKFLDNIVVGDDPYVIALPWFDGTVQAWGDLTLDGPGLEAVKNHKGIKEVQVALELEYNLVLPEVEVGPKKTPRHMDRAIDSRGATLRRALSWKKQQYAPWDLVIDSLPR
jgi:hypothetical protein